MMKELFSVIMFVLIILVFFSGCTSTDNVTAEEIREQFIEQVSSISSYQYSANGIMTITSTNSSGTSTLESDYTLSCDVDISNKKMNIEMILNTQDYGGITSYIPSQQNIIYYYENDSLYTTWMDNLTWNPWGGDNNWYAYALVERAAYFILAGSNIERLNDENIGGAPCYVLEVDPYIGSLELQSASTDFLFSQGLSDERYLEVIIKYWIEKDTNFLKKAYYKVLTNVSEIWAGIGGDVTSATSLHETEILFDDYNIPIRIQPPWQSYLDEAENTLGELEYINLEYGYGLNPPDDWVIDDYYSVDFLLEFHVEGISDSDLTLEIRPPYDDIFTQEEKNLSSEISRLIEYYTNDSTENVVLVSHSERTINGMDAYEFVVDSTYYGTWKIKSVYVEKGDRLFELEYKTLPEYYDTYIAVVDESIDSFMCVSPYYSISI